MSCLGLDRTSYRVVLGGAARWQKEDELGPFELGWVRLGEWGREGVLVLGGKRTA